MVLGFKKRKMNIINTLILGLLLSLSLTAQEWVIEPQYLAAGDFSEGLACVAIGDSYQSAEVGFIDESGEWIISPAQLQATGISANSGNTIFSEDLAMMKESSSRGLVFIDKSGEIVLNLGDYTPDINFTSYGSIYGFSEGLFSVGRKKEETYEYGYMNKAGEMVIPFQFAVAGSFSEGLAPVLIQTEDEYGLKNLLGYIDKAGTIVIEPKYAVVFTPGIIMNFSFKNGKVEVLDMDLANANPTIRFITLDKSGNELSIEEKSYRDVTNEMPASYEKMLSEKYKTGDLMPQQTDLNDYKSKWGYVRK